VGRRNSVLHVIEAQSRTKEARPHWFNPTMWELEPQLLDLRIIVSQSIPEANASDGRVSTGTKGDNLS